jgi:hypothetical protein
MSNKTESINRLAGASISSQPTLDDTVGLQPARRYRRYGAEIKNSNTNIHGAMPNIVQNTTGYSSLIDNVNVRYESTSPSLWRQTSWYKDMHEH